MSTLAVDNITDEVGTGSPAFTNGLAQSDIAGALNATGTAPIYACRAWVNFDGTTATIRDSGNVSSITKNGTGDFTVNFATAMPDTNYAPHASSDAQQSNVGYDRVDIASSSKVQIRHFENNNFVDVLEMYVTIFR
jgi:hypothetical protein